MVRQFLSMWKGLPWLAGKIPVSVAMAIGLMAGVGPEDAQSNLSEWLQLVGLPPLKGVLTPIVDVYTFWVCVVFVVVWVFPKSAIVFCPHYCIRRTYDVGNERLCG